MESLQDQDATVIWNDESAEPPSIPGVYRVKYKDHCGKVDLIVGRPVVAYWDGVDTWSFPWATTVKEAYSAKMMSTGRKLEWTGEALSIKPPSDRAIEKPRTSRPKP